MGLWNSAPPPPPPPASAAPVAPKTPLTLRASDFQAQAQIVGARSKLAVYRVPRGEIVELDAVKPFRLQLKARHSTQITGDSSGNASINLGDQGIDFIRSARPAPGGPTREHPDVVVYAVPIGGGTRSKRTITSYSAENGTVNVSQLSAGTTYQADVYFTPGEGAVRLVAVQPSGVDAREVEIYNDTLRALHETNQASGLTAPRLMRGGAANYPLGPKWELAIEVDTGLTMAFESDAENIVLLPAYRLPVTVRDASRLNETVSRRLR